MADRFDKFSEQGRLVLTRASEEAQRFGHNYIGTEHLLLGLTRQEDSVAGRVLAHLGVEVDKLRASVEFIIGRGDRPVVGAIGLTPRAKKSIELAVDEARGLNHHYIGTEHLLLGIVREGENIAAGVLQSLGVGLDQVRSEIMRVLAIDPSQRAEQAEPTTTTDRPSERTRGTAALRHALISIRAAKDAAVSEQNYELAARLRDIEVTLEQLLEP
jgi:ATP-dependent Clp protease ATP-binding subunit ClpC